MGKHQNPEDRIANLMMDMMDVNGEPVIHDARPAKRSAPPERARDKVDRLRQKRPKQKAKRERWHPHLTDKILTED